MNIENDVLYVKYVGTVNNNPANYKNTQYVWKCLNCGAKFTDYLEHGRMHGKTTVKKIEE